MSPTAGLSIGGHQITNSDSDFFDYIRFALIGPDAQGSATFTNGSRAEIEAMADPLAVEIVEAMIADSAHHAWKDPGELRDNITFRMGVIAAMNAMTIGDWDADYFEAAQGIPPTLGKCQNLRFLIDGLTTPSGDPAHVADVVDEMNQHWNHLDVKHTPWDGWKFKQSPKSKGAADSLAHTHPFRGECAGAVLLSLLAGCRAAYGAESIDALPAFFGPVYIGQWYSGLQTFPSCGRALFYEDQGFDTDYKRGAVIGVPGDYFYFQNKKGYYHASHKGAWQGENCIYMGKDWLGHPHYSGLGLGWKTEATLRMFLTNAYVHDCNTALMNSRDAKTGKVNGTMHIVEDPDKQLYFTTRGILRYPELSNYLPFGVKITKPRKRPKPDDMHAVLDKLGLATMADGLWGADAVPLEALTQALDFHHDDLLQLPKTPAFKPQYGVMLGDWELTLRPADTPSDPETPPQLVEVRVRAPS